MIKIILSDPRGGVLSVSNSLMDALNNQCVDCSMLNMCDFGGRLYNRIIKTFRLLLKESRDVQLVLQHFDAIFLGLFLPLFGFKRIVNVVHIDLVEYYNGVNVFKKAVISVIFFLIRKKLIVFVSKEAELKSVSRFKLKRASTIYNIFDFPCLKPSARSRVPKETIVLGVVSRLHKVKNVDLAILVVNELRRRDINVVLNIYGGGSNIEILKLEELVRVLGADNFINFHGVVNNKSAIFTSIDGLISFSSIEGLPTVILESIGYGVPIFYTDCGSGPRELMSAGSNVLEKTTSYERTGVGYLIRPVFENKNYEPQLFHHECVYVDYLAAFVNDIINSKFSMSFDGSKFSSDSVVKQWQKLVCTDDCGY